MHAITKMHVQLRLTIARPSGGRCACWWVCSLEALHS